MARYGRVSDTYDRYNNNDRICFKRRRYLMSRSTLLCAAVITLCLLIYMTIYNKAMYIRPRGVVEGWPANKSRDTKTYIQPNNITTIHEPVNICQDGHILPVLIVVCSSIENFELRRKIRKTWANYENYKKTSQIFDLLQNKNVSKKTVNNRKYTNSFTPATLNSNTYVTKTNELLPLTKAITNLISVKTNPKLEVKLDSEEDNVLVKDDLNEDLYIKREENVKTYTEEGNLSIFTKMNTSNELFEHENSDRDFKVVFLMGYSLNGSVQDKVEEEASKYGDIIQESFVDSYNNLTLKSIMMLKWVSNNCEEKVQYILKTDDDVFVNVPLVVARVRDDFQGESLKYSDYLMMGYLIVGAKPEYDVRHKCYSPRRMFHGAGYPPYLSGYTYVLSAPTVRALYYAALDTPFFHLEDIYVTGTCSQRAFPPVPLRNISGLSHRYVDSLCDALTLLSTHRVNATRIRQLYDASSDLEFMKRCEKDKFTKVCAARWEAEPPRALTAH